MCGCEATYLKLCRIELLGQIIKWLRIVFEIFNLKDGLGAGEVVLL